METDNEDLHSIVRSVNSFSPAEKRKRFSKIHIQSVVKKEEMTSNSDI